MKNNLVMRVKFSHILLRKETKNIPNFTNLYFLITCVIHCLHQVELRAGRKRLVACRYERKRRVSKLRTRNRFRETLGRGSECL